jgi:hypothetical protein
MPEMIAEIQMLLWNPLSTELKALPHHDRYDIIEVFSDLLTQLLVCVANTCAFSLGNRVKVIKSFESSLRF